MPTPHFHRNVLIICKQYIITDYRLIYLLRKVNWVQSVYQRSRLLAWAALWCATFFKTSSMRLQACVCLWTESSSSRPRSKDEHKGLHDRKFVTEISTCNQSPCPPLGIACFLCYLFYPAFNDEDTRFLGSCRFSQEQLLGAFHFKLHCINLNAPRQDKSMVESNFAILL